MQRSAKQTTPLLTYTENRVTNAIESPDTHRTPLPCEALTFELTGYTATGPAGRFQASDFVEPDPAAAGRLRHKFTAPEVAYEATATGNQRRRPIEWLRTLYRRDDLTGLLPLGELQPLAPARRKLQARLHARPARRRSSSARTQASRRSLAARPGSGARRPGWQPGRLPAKPDAQGRRPLPCERRRRPLVDPVRAVLLQHEPRRQRRHRTRRRPGSTSSCRAATATPSARTPSSTSTPTTC